MIFKEIFDRYYLPVKSYGFQYIEDDEIVEDFVQDAFLKVWEKRADFYFVAAIKSFLYMSVRNACLDYLRHQKVQRRNEPELILWLTEEGEEEFILNEGDCIYFDSSQPHGMRSVGEEDATFLAIIL